MTEEPTGRTAEFARPSELESMLALLSEAIGPGGDEIARRFAAPHDPMVLVVGCPRSGTTVVTQWLSSSGAFACPSNLVSRFHRAPAVGAIVERLLVDPALDFRGETAIPRAGVDRAYESALGKTVGPTAPNEFWYFWRRHFDFEGAADDGDPVGAGDLDGFLAELAAYEFVMGRPIALKALIATRHLPDLLAALPPVVVVDVRRDESANIASLLRARRAHGGDEASWYSFVPRGGVDTHELSPREQVAAQVVGLRRDIETALVGQADETVVRVRLEDFTSAPTRAWASIRSAMLAAGGSDVGPYQGPDVIPSG